MGEAASETGVADNEEGKSTEKRLKREDARCPKVLADGTYATGTAFTSAADVRLEVVKAAAKLRLLSEFLLQSINSLLFTRSWC